MKKILIVILLFGVSCMHKNLKDQMKNIKFPVAAKKPHTMTKHGDIRNDDYFWLKERENPEVIQYLNAENTYTENILQGTKSQEEAIFKEIKSRVKEDDSSVPVKKDGYYYYVRYELGSQYGIYARKKGSETAKEEILLNVNEMAKGHAYFSSTGPNMSTNHEIMAYGEDTQGRRFYTFYFKNLKTGKVLDHKIENITSNLTWANDNKTVFYTQQDPNTLRSNKIYRYNLETGKTELVFEEKDETFSCGVGKGIAKKFIYISSGATLTTETRFLDANHPEGKFTVFLPREHDHRYDIQESEDGFYVVTNWHAKNYRLMKTPYGHLEKSNWKEIIPHRKNAYLEDVSVFKNFLAIEERVDGLMKLILLDKKSLVKHEIPFKDQAYVAGFGGTAEYDTDLIRYQYESMRLPSSTYDYNYKTKKTVLKKQKEVPHFDPEKYKVERIFITARDGVKVPVSALMKKDFKANGQAPLLIYGYGSYGYSIDPGFNSPIFSLIDRGFVFAIAHVRGGSDLGREWYDKGRTTHKLNTFTDFIDCTEWFIVNRYVSKDHVFAQGGSAGGLLMGAIANMRPDLYKGILAQVPFVDVVTTMLDDTIPLTTGEYDEWGNPNEKKFYDYIKSYSPYDNVKPQPYPHMLVTTGLHDSQVQYWEPAKWVAKLRQSKTNDSFILMKTNMSAGHGGASGRFEFLKETAEGYNFILLINSLKN